MPDYSKGKIYKIVDNTSDMVYVGSTCEPTLARRLAGHVGNYKQYLKGDNKHHFITSFQVLENGNYDIQLIENYPCACRDELHSREAHFIRLLDCVNKVVPHRTHKQYIEDNKDKVKASRKKYMDNNRDKINASKRKYMEDPQRREQKREICKSYYAKHDEKYREQHLCECGANYTHNHKSRHDSSQRHKSYIQRIAQYEELLAMDTKRIERQAERAKELEQVEKINWKK